MPRAGQCVDLSLRKYCVVMSAVRRKQARIWCDDRFDRRTGLDRRQRIRRPLSSLEVFAVLIYFVLLTASSLALSAAAAPVRPIPEYMSARPAMLRCACGCFTPTVLS